MTCACGADEFEITETEDEPGRVVLRCPGCGARTRVAGVIEPAPEAEAVAAGELSGESVRVSA